MTALVWSQSVVRVIDVEVPTQSAESWEGRINEAVESVVAEAEDRFARSAYTGGVAVSLDQVAVVPYLDARKARVILNIGVRPEAD